MWDRSLVVVSADHGEGWVPGEPSRTLRERNAPDLMWVPQFIKTPGQDGGVVDDRNWEQVDLLPTVADLAGVAVPWKTDGVSQTGKPARTRTAKWWFDVPGRRKVRDGPANWKVVLAGETDTLARAAEGVRGLYRYGASADLVYRAPASVGPIGGATVLAAVNGRIGGGSSLVPGRPGEPADRFAVITPDFLWRAGDGRRQLQLYLLDRSGGQPRLRPVSVTAR
jgi:hypothetical protein